MIENFNPLRQAPGGKSCVPTCVRAVLLWHHSRVSQEEVSEWCDEDPLGCDWSRVLEGLAEAGYVVDEFRGNEGKWDRLQAAVNDVDDPQPVIVTLQKPFRDLNGDHAVVVTSIALSDDPDEGTVVYMDPLSGALETDTISDFQFWWRQADERAFTVTP